MPESFKKDYKTITNQDEFIELTWLNIVKGHWMLVQVQYAGKPARPRLFGGYQR